MTRTTIRCDFQDTNDSELQALLIWNALTEPGDRVAGQLRQLLGNQIALDKLLGQNTSEVADLSENELELAFQRWLPRYRDDLSFEVIANAERGDMKLLMSTDPQWPKALNDLAHHSPTGLWYRGNVKHFEKLSRSVAIVGSRTATTYGQKVTADLVSAISTHESAVVSGGALGIDAIAHRVALAENVLTVGVMAGSLDNLYPAGNWQLFEEIAHRGLLVSEMVPGSKPTKWRFLQRNRLIAAMSQAVVVTEAGWRSGSINTVNHANDLGRRVFAVPGSIHSPSSAGCNRLIRDQLAEILLDAADLPEEIGWTRQHFDQPHSGGSFELRILDHLGRKERTLAQLVLDSGLSQFEAQIALSSLELKNQVGRGLNGGWTQTFGAK